MHKSTLQRAVLEIRVGDFVKIDGELRRLALNLHAESFTRSKEGELREEEVVIVELKHESDASMWSNDDAVTVTLLKL